MRVHTPNERYEWTMRAVEELWKQHGSKTGRAPLFSVESPPPPFQGQMRRLKQTGALDS